MPPPPARSPVMVVLLLCLASAPSATAQDPPASGATFTPQFAQAGKDVVWVPSPTETVELMLDIAGVTSADYVIDLGSGDGRTVIAAARRGARALGVEYNPEMVTLSRQEALRAGVADRARFVEGDMYEADVSEADVLALFLLSENLRKLAPTFLSLRPGTRIVSNTFTIPGWTPELTARRDEPCTAWCTVLLYLVPAAVDGEWRTADGDTLRLVQQAQEVGGELLRGDTRTPLHDVRLRGAALRFRVGDDQVDAVVNGDVITGTRRTSAGTPVPWEARK